MGSLRSLLALKNLRIVQYKFKIWLRIMFHLSIDASQTMIEVCLRQDKQTIKLIQQKLNSIEHLPLFVSEILKELHLNLNKLSSISLINGPGSYTSLRACVLLVKSMAISLKVPVMSRKRTEVLIYACQHLNKPVLAVQFVRQAQYYAALGQYRSQAIKYVGEAQLMNQEEILTLQHEHQCPVIGDWPKEHLEGINPIEFQQATEYLARWAEESFEAEAIDLLEPFYIRPAVQTTPKSV
jgi:tRNA threonylcarbamoyl adenosine modification protein YeaZ